MKKSKIIVFVFLILLLVLQIVFFVILKKHISALEKETKNNYKYLETGFLELTELIQGGNLEIKDAVDNICLLLTDYSLMLEENNKNIKKVDNTYSNILNEQKLKTVDVTKTDSAIIKMKKEAFEQYRNKNYYEGVDLCQKILIFQSEDFETRELLIKCLYYTNPFDSTKYDEILNHIKILSRSTNLSPVILEIEQNIKSEKGLN